VFGGLGIFGALRLAGSILSGRGVQALAGTIADVLKNRTDRQAEVDVQGVRSDEVIAVESLRAISESNRLKTEIRLREGKWGPTVIFGLALFAIPTGVWYWFIVLDSVPFYVPYLMETAHRVGSWRVSGLGKGDALNDAAVKIILSFFVVDGVARVARLFARR
jgi:hypothetical protein